MGTKWPIHFGWVNNILDGFNSFWSGPNHFGQFLTTKISPEKSNLDLIKMIWTRSIQFFPIRNNLDGAKSFWTNYVTSSDWTKVKKNHCKNEKVLTYNRCGKKWVAYYWVSLSVFFWQKIVHWMFNLILRS